MFDVGVSIFLVCVGYVYCVIIKFYLIFRYDWCFVVFFLWLFIECVYGIVCLVEFGCGVGVFVWVEMVLVGVCFDCFGYVFIKVILVYVKIFIL